MTLTTSILSGADLLKISIAWKNGELSPVDGPSNPNPLTYEDAKNNVIRVLMSLDDELLGKFIQRSYDIAFDEFLAFTKIVESLA